MYFSNHSSRPRSSLFIRGFILAGIVSTISAFAARAETPGASPYVIGERLDYTIHWGLFHVGTGAYETSMVEDEQGRSLISIVMTSHSAGIADKVYPVDSRIEVLIDPDTRLPVKLVKKTREGWHVCDDVLTFDRERNIARWEDFQNDKVAEYPIEPETRDFYSMMYETRSGALTPGDEMMMSVASDDKMHAVKVFVLEETDIKTEDRRTLPGLLLDIEAVTEGLFDRKIPSKLYITREDPKYVIRMNVKVPIGSVKVVLSNRTVADEPTAVAMGRTPVPAL